MNTEAGFFSGLAQTKIAVVGLGLMGGSLAMALRGKCCRLLGVDWDPRTLKVADELSIVDRLSDEPAEILPLADMIILAVPVQSILTYLENLPKLHPGKAVILDLGSTKSVILQAMQALPERFDPLGGHPMCGKETSSILNAEPALYQGATFVFTPLPRTSLQARQLAQELATALGAHPLWLDPETHDRWAAFTSHTPYLLANALSACVPGEAALLVGPGYRSTARLAGSSVEMMRDILSTNQAFIIDALRRVCQRLDILGKLLEQGQWQDLAALLTEGKSGYEALTNLDLGRENLPAAFRDY